MFASFPFYTQNKFFRGNFVKHQKDLYDRSTREYGLWFNYRRQEYVLTLYNLSHKNTAVERHTKHTDFLSEVNIAVVCAFFSSRK